MAKLTPFQQKFHELETLKKDSLQVVSRFNALHLQYADWFKRRSQSFVDVIKTLQVGARSLAPQSICTVAHFKAVKMVADELSGSGRPLPRAQELEQFIEYWNRYCSIKLEMGHIMDRMYGFCESIGKLREPEIKDHIDFLYHELNEQYSETFNFNNTHNEKDNLYTYKVSTCDSEFHGLVSYIPFLIGQSTKVLYLVTKLNLEKL